jgi:hypothetical protein
VGLGGSPECCSAAEPVRASPRPLPSDGVPLVGHVAARASACAGFLRRTGKRNPAKATPAPPTSQAAEWWVWRGRTIQPLWADASAATEAERTHPAAIRGQGILWVPNQGHGSTDRETVRVTLERGGDLALWRRSTHQASGPAGPAEGVSGRMVGAAPCSSQSPEADPMEPSPSSQSKRSAAPRHSDRGNWTSSCIKLFRARRRSPSTSWKRSALNSRASSAY